MKPILRRTFLLLILSQTFPLSAFSRNDTIPLNRAFGMKIGGFVRNDFFYDSRQTVEGVEGLLIFYPKPPDLDNTGKDINAAPAANFLSLTSRLNSRFYGPDVLGAKASAFLEFDFTGTSNTNGVRLRQAYLDFAWDKTSLLVGRTWHPLSNSMPATLSINQGAPFWAFNRSDQVRFNYRPGKWLLSATASYQSDYASLGPIGKSSSYLRNAVWPEWTLNIEHHSPTTLIGIAGNTKTIKPRPFTLSPEDNTTRYATDETLTTFTGQLYFQYQSSKWKIKAQSIYNQNMTESLLIGGYAVSATDPVTGRETYTPTQYMNYWLNVVYGTKWQAVFFAGYLNSLGTLDKVSGPWYARDPGIKYMYRLSPQLTYNVNNWHFGIELDYTAVSYGTIKANTRGEIVNNKNIGNLRTLLAVSFDL